MNQLKPSAKTLAPRRLILIVIAMMGLGLLGRLALIADLSADERFMAVVPDDAFYYFTVAQNIAEGHGSTFDRLAPTNGYHPLWLLVLVPVLLLPMGKLSTVLVAIALGGSIWVLGSPFLFRGACRWFRAPEPALVLLGLYLFTPSSVLFSINGLETSLVVVLTIAFLDWLGRSVEPGGVKSLLCTDHPPVPVDDAEPVQSRDLTPHLFGVWAGVIFLARTDSVFLIAAASAALLLAGRRSERGLSLRGVLTALGTTALVAGPWLLWNLFTVGELVQSSGKALPWIYQEFARRAEFLDTGEMIRRGLGQARGAGLFTWEMAGLPTPQRNFFRSVAPAVAVLWLAASCFRHVRKRPAAWPQVTFVAAICFTLAFHAAFRWYPREWYFALPVITLYGVLTFAVYRLAGRWILMIGGLACVLAAGSFDWRNPGPYPAQIGAWAGAENHDRLLEIGELLGSTDAGISGYVMRRGSVVNLDGLVNSEILPYYRAGNVADYIRSRGIPMSYLRPPFFHPIFTGPGRLYLFGTEPHGTPQLYRLMDASEMLERQFPSEPVAFGRLAANKYAGPGWEMPREDLPFRTARGPQAQIYVPLHTETAYALSVELRAALPDAPVDVSVSIGDEHLGGARLEHAWTTLDLELPTRRPPKLETDPVTTLTLDSAGSGSRPVHHGDPSIQIRAFRVLPSAEAASPPTAPR